MPKPIRWKGFIPFAIVIAAVCAFNMLFLDSLLKDYARSAAENLTGAEVEIDDFDFQLLNAALVSEGIRAVDKDDPARNLFEIERAQLDFDANFLSRKKIVADNIVIEGVKTGTFRPGAKGVKGAEEKTPAAPVEEKEKEEEKEKSFDFSAFVDKPDIRKLADELNIPAVNEAKALEALIKEKKRYWERSIAEISDTRELKRLLARIRKIDPKSYKSLKDIPRLQKDIKLIRKTREKVDERLKDARKMRKAFNKDRKILKARLKRIKDMSSQGISSMLLPASSKKDLAKTLLNAVLDDSLVARGFYFLELYEKYKDFIPKIKKREKPKTDAGVDVDFIKAGDVPMFYAKRIAFSGKGNDFSLSGIVQGLSSDLSWKPIDLDLKYREKQTSSQIQGRLEMKNRKLSGRVRAAMRKFSFDRLDVSDSNILIGVKGKGNIVMDIQDENDKLVLDMSVAAVGQVSFLLKTDKMGGETKNVLNKLFTNLKNLFLKVRFEKSDGKTNYSMNSSIYKVIGRRLNQILTKRLSKVKKDVKIMANRRLSEKLAPLRSQLAGLTGGNLDQVLSDLTPARKKLNAQRKKLEEKLKKTREKKAKELLKLLK